MCVCIFIYDVCVCVYIYKLKAEIVRRKAVEEARAKILEGCVCVCVCM